jgi:putative tryptophan/tyrosine transport system substrate-binding protein
LKAATSSIPIVAWTYDPIKMGLVQSLAHPGGNITGVASDTGLMVWGKRIELLRLVFPAMAKVGVLSPDNLGWRQFIEPAVRAACETERDPRVTALYDWPPSEARYRAAIDSATRTGADAILVADTLDTYENRALIADLVAQARLPAIYAIREAAEVGGLMAYQADGAELSKRIAQDIDAILRGSKPGDIPYFRGTKFEFVVNLKTAKKLGLALPQLLLAQVDEVIE